MRLVYLIENLIKAVEEMVHLQYVLDVYPNPFPISPELVPLDDMHPGQEVLLTHVTLAGMPAVVTREHGPPFGPEYPERQVQAEDDELALTDVE